MAKQKTERRNYDEEFITKLTEIYTRQTTVLSRLAKINGSVEEYNERKHLMTDNQKDIITICDRLIAHDTDHKNLDDRYIGKKLFTTLSIILGVLIIGFNLLQYFTGV